MFDLTGKFARVTRVPGGIGGSIDKAPADLEAFAKTLGTG